MVVFPQVQKERSWLPQNQGIPDGLPIRQHHQPPNPLEYGCRESNPDPELGKLISYH